MNVILPLHIVHVALQFRAKQNPVHIANGASWWIYLDRSLGISVHVFLNSSLVSKFPKSSNVNAAPASRNASAGNDEV
jgi:hypothetical protein